MENALLGKELILSERCSPVWSENAQYMECFIRSTEQYLNACLACQGYLSPETILRQLDALPFDVTDILSWLESIRFIRYDPAKVLKISIDRMTEDRSYILIVTYKNKEGEAKV